MGTAMTSTTCRGTIVKPSAPAVTDRNERRDVRTFSTWLIVVLVVVLVIAVPISNQVVHRLLIIGRAALHFNRERNDLTCYFGIG